MAEADLRLLLRTIADTRGAEQTSAALRRIQQQAAQIQQQQSMSAWAGGFNVASASVLKFAGSLGIAVTAAEGLRAVQTFMADSLEVFVATERTARAVAAAYGQASSQVVRFSRDLSSTTGFSARSIQEAALSARTLSQNYGLTIEQTQRLIRVSADLAQMRGIGVAEAFERIQSAIRGEAEASEYLGLTLNDTFLKNVAMNGSLRKTFETMTDAQKAQVRYNEVLRQTQQFQGLAAQGAQGLEGSQRAAARATEELQRNLGRLLAPAAQVAASAMADLTKAVANYSTEVDRAPGLPGARQPVPQPGPVAQQARTDEQYRLLVTQSRGRAEATMRELREAESHARRMVGLIENQGLTPTPTAAQLAQQAYQDQLQAAMRDLIGANEQQQSLQRQSVVLAAEEARIRQSMLPTQMRMAELQRSMTEQQIRARQAALPATEALEDLRYEQERARLIAANRQMSAADRSAARRQLREIGRAEPGVALRALEAERSIVPSSRAATRLDMEAQILDIATQRGLAGVDIAQQQNQFAAAIAQATIQAQQQVVSDIVRAAIDQGLQARQPTTVVVNVTHEDGRTTTYTELIEANAQAQLPPITPSSGVRR
jgi:hypothetical protein